MSNVRQAWTDAVNQRQAKPKRSKYGAVKTTVDGITFASKKEAQRYHELKLMEKAGEIRALILQPIFTLRVDEIEIGAYRADFRYETKLFSAQKGWTWQLVVEDVKGFKTPLYRWKKRHVEIQYAITIKEV